MQQIKSYLEYGISLPLEEFFLWVNRVLKNFSEVKSILFILVITELYISTITVTVAQIEIK